MGNSSRRHYRENYLNPANSAVLNIMKDPAFPNQNLVNYVGPPSGIKRRATSTGVGKIRYPSPSELRMSSGTGFFPSPTFAPAANGFIVESHKLNYVYGASNFALSGNAINWVQTNMFGAGILSEPGPDGEISAVVLNALLNNANIKLSRGAIGTGTRVFTVWLKRKIGSGPVLLTLNDFNSSIDISNGLSATEWRRFRITAASGQVIVGIGIQNAGESVAAYAPGIYLTGNLGTGLPSSTSVPDNQILTSQSDGFSHYLQGPRPCSGITVLCHIDPTTWEDGWYDHVSNTWVTNSHCGGGIIVGSHDGDVAASMQFAVNGLGGSCNMSFDDFPNTATSVSEAGVGDMPAPVRLAITMRDNYVACLSNNHSPIVLNISGFVFDDPGYGAGDPPYVSLSADGSMYVKYLKVLPYSMNAGTLQSFVDNINPYL